MKLKEAYKQAFKEEIEPLVAAGKITLLGTLEETVEDIATSVFAALNKGAILSDEKWDDVLVPPLVGALKSRAFEAIDKIDGEVDQVRA